MNFDFYEPVHIVFGAGKVDTIGDYAKKYGKKALIVTGRSSAKKSGLYDRVKDALKAEGIDSVLFDEVRQNPLTTTAQKGADMAKAEGCELVVALGGGSIMDCAKSIAFLAVNDGDINDYIFGRKVSDEALPMILVPTTCGTGSEGNGFAVLTNPDTGDKKSLRTSAIIAKVSIVDPQCMMTMPKHVLASVGFDALCHCMEAYTANNAQPFTDALSLMGIRYIVESIVPLYEGSQDEDLWDKMTLAATIGGMVIGQAGVTLAHGMEHPASGLKDIVHGQGLACLTPSVIEATMCPKYEHIAKIFGTDDLVQAIKDLIAKLELPTKLSDLGLEEKDIDWMSENCMKVSAGNLVNTPVKVDIDLVRKLYQKAM